MNVLIVGGVSSLLNQIIRKVKKEGHRVYLLTGNRYGTDVYEKVFERYDLSYDSDCLGDVFESANPDVTLFMGAFDSNFRWSNEERELVRLTSSLINLLTAHSMAGKGRFICLSSEAVYSKSYETNIPEDTPVSPADIKGMALAQCEDICASFQKNRGADIVVLRIDHFYMIPQGPDDVNEICSQMCLEALRTGSISVDSGRHFSLLYESDAVIFIFKLIRCGEHQHFLYHLSASQELTELEIAQYIQQAMSEKSDVMIEETQKKEHRCILDNHRFSGEFGDEFFADTQETVQKMVEYMAAHKELFLTGEQEKKSLWKRITENVGAFIRAVIPYLENLICFILVYLLNSRNVGEQFFYRLDFYLLYVLLFAVMYGQQQATVSAILAVIGFYLAQLNGQEFLTITLEYGTYLWIAQLFIVGQVVGYIKNQILKLKTERDEERQFLNRQLSDIKDINGSNVRVKDALESEVVNQRDSVGKVYHITSKLEQYMPEEVLFYAAEIMGELLKSGDIAIYTVSNKAYARLFTFTSEKAKVLGKSLRYRELGEVYGALAEGKVYINRSLDQQYPMMANAIFDEDQMKMIIMVWGIPWERMTLGQADLLTVISYLIQNAVLRATRQIDMLENQRYQDDGYVLEQEAFAPLLRAFLAARNKGLTECAILQVPLPDGEPVDRAPRDPAKGGARLSKKPQGLSAVVNQRLSAMFSSLSGKNQTGQKTTPSTFIRLGKYRNVGKILNSKIRQDDYIGTLEDGNLYILLSNSNNEDAAYVIERIQEEGYNCFLLENFG